MPSWDVLNLKHLHWWLQVTDILARLAICEKASIDECYLDITAEAKRRLEQSPASLAPPARPDQIHVCGEVLTRYLQ